MNAFSLLTAKLSEEPSLCTEMNSSSFSGTSCLRVTRTSPCDSIPRLIECWLIGDVSPRGGDKMHVPLRYQFCLSHTHTHSHCFYQSRASLAQQSLGVKREAQGGLWVKRFPYFTLHGLRKACSPAEQRLRPLYGDLSPSSCSISASLPLSLSHSKAVFISSGSEPVQTVWLQKDWEMQTGLTVNRE